MGLPQIPPGEAAESNAPLGAVLNNSPQFSDRSPSSIRNMNSVHTHGCATCTLGSSFDGFPKSASSEMSNASDKTFFRGAMEVASNVHSLKIDSTDRRSTIFASKSGRSFHAPASRVVGFESGCRTISLTDGPNEVPAANLPYFASAPVNDTESASSLVRKRLLSPLSSMLSPSHFKGESLDIGCRNNQAGSLVKNDNVRKLIAQDNKKANIGSKSSYPIPSWSLASCFEHKSIPHSTESIFQTDGPVLEHRGFISKSDSHTARIDHLRESSLVRPQSCAISESPVTSSLSFSPLGPRLSERIKSTGKCRSVAEEIKNSNLNLRSIEQSPNNSSSRLMLNHKDDGLEISSKSFEDVEYLCKDFCPSSLDDVSDMNWPLSQESAPTSNCMRFTRSLSGLSVRRSLVGSFEESLLSGRFLSGNHTKVCI